MDISPEHVCVLPAGHCALCLDTFSQCRKNGLPRSLCGCVFSSALDTSFLCTLKTNEVGQDPFLPVWCLAVGIAAFPTTLYLESVSLSASSERNPGDCSVLLLLIAEPKSQTLQHLHPSPCAYSSQRRIFPSDVIILGGP